MRSTTPDRHVPRFTRRFAVVALLAGLLVVAAASVAAVALSQARRDPAQQAAATGLATVVRRDLVATQQVPGTIGYGLTTTLYAPGGSGPQALAQGQAAVDAQSQKLTADQQAAADQASVNQQAAEQAQAAVDADQRTLASDQQLQAQDEQQLATDRSQACPPGPPPSPNSPCATAQTIAQDQQRVAADARTVVADQGKLAADQAAAGSAAAAGQQKAGQAQAQVGADQVALGSARTALANLQGQPIHGTVYTVLPVPGQLVSPGAELYGVDGHAVPLFAGTTPLYRRLAVGVSGPDVRQLQQGLDDLGFGGPGLAVDGTFEAADAAAVGRWQASIGVPRTGEVWLGDLVFLPGPVRVAAVHPAAGAPVQPGQPILDLTSGTRAVTVQLPPSLAYSVRQGDAATIDLPDGRTRIPASVTTVSAVAQQVPGSQVQTQNGAPQTTIPVTIAPADPRQLPDLDSAPVTVDVTTESAKNVLAVPVNALLALAGGGYGVEVPGQPVRLVTVQTGIFDNSMVEVSGAGLAEGMRVVVPAS